MEATKYDLTYKCVAHAVDAVSELSKLIELLKTTTEPMTCKQIGLALYGDDYKQIPWAEIKKLPWGGPQRKAMNQHNEQAQSYSSKLGTALSKLLNEGYIKFVEVAGEPRTFETEECVRVCNDQIAEEFIEVFDKQGNRYEMKNPDYCNAKYEWRKVMVTKTPTFRAYLWND